ncbi:NAD kinase-like isoform X3 [Xenia sp. Carnegie-2017]|uniref:NAD kinase-like isoform X3 n=1 Tax=Xenia sp. Carnegie-2017 TaxID=2897299 RepID=UPI001F047193|nr:NAD kinase-like isoform X3 [Xenia sp. Carnegie-2017]
MVIVILSFCSLACKEILVVISRRRSCHGPKPVTKFGPKAKLVDDQSVEDCSIFSTCDPSSMMLGWKSEPRQVLIIKKPGDDDYLNRSFTQLAYWLVQEMNFLLYIEPATLSESGFDNEEEHENIRSKINIWEQEADVSSFSDRGLEASIDFIITLGGDGTLLYAASLFQHSCPPVIAYHIGSLGFLTCFKFPNYKQDLKSVVNGNGKLILRKRLECTLMLKTDNDCKLDDNKMIKSYTVLNELLIDRGSAQTLSNLDVYLNDRLITTVQGDGLIVSTPTGSTAYAAAAGGSMVHPSVPGILLTPVCPHSLSSRPVIVPSGVELKIILSQESRCGAFASFDGRNRYELRRGDGIRVMTSVYPVPCLTQDDQITDWFTSLGECLHWNVRQKQKPL